MLRGVLMSAEVVKFQADDGDKASVIEILEHALEEARAGKVKDVAVVMALHDENGPQHVTAYHGNGAFAVLVAGVQSLAFDLQYRAYVERE